YLEKIYNSGEMLLSIVNDVLDISKIEAGKMDLVESDYDVPSLINDTVTQNILRIGEKPIELKLDIGEDLFSQLHGDELRVKQIINNLLSNAIKYTDKGTVELSVHCEREDEKVWVTIIVSDTGIGIREEDMENLFSDFAQMDLLSHRKTEGTGLGLPITKNLAGMMGGTIEVSSEYSKGSVFTVRIAQRFISEVRIDQKVVDNLKSFRYSDEKRGKNAQLKRISLPYARVLVVDDNLTNLDVAKGLMKPYGMQVDCVSSAQQAINAIRDGKVRYNAVFMDHMMPGIDGIEATRIIRETIGTEYARNVPIIALTANAIIGNESMFLSKGFQALVSKPIEIARLDEVIRRWVRDKEQEKTPLSDTETEHGPARQILENVQIPMLNIPGGLKLYGGDEDIYLKILRSYATNSGALLEGLKAVNADSLDDYSIVVHGIKGSSRSIGADLAGDLAEALEKAAKAGEYAFVKENNAVLIECVAGLTGSIKGLLEMTAEENSKPQKDRPDTELLRKLFNACDNFAADEIEALIKELDSYEYESGGDLAEELVKYANQFNFIAIKEKLAALFAE
ncbi:MAG: ATP-binding protein, partial [Oscillospiraceae bacterium]|nr:ATP-binding protein [Oscillospiraceae bacterium]